jgi:hypothetical protein
MKKICLIISFIILLSSVLLLADNLKIPAKAVEKIDPKYRKTLLGRGETETVILTVFINPDSSIAKIKVNYGKSPFDSLAVRTVKKWQFEPGFVGGKAVFDSLTTSIEFFGKKEIIIDSAKLYKEIVNYDKLFRFHYINQKTIYRENQHIIPFYDEEKLFMIDEFVLPKNILKRDKQIINFSIIDSLNSDNVFFMKNYKLPVAFSALNAGIGDGDMNFGNIFFSKGNPFGLEDSQISFHFFGQKGNWVNQEKSFDLGISFFQKIANTELKYSYINIGETLPAIYLRKYNNLETIKPMNTVNSLTINNKLISAGIMRYYEKNSLFHRERDDSTIYFRKNFMFYDLTYNHKISYTHSSNYFKGIGTKNKISNDIKIKYKIASNVSLKSRFYYGYQYDYFSDNSLDFKFHNKLISLFFSQLKTDDAFSFVKTQRKVGNRIFIKSKNNRIDLFYGFLSNSSKITESKFIKLSTSSNYKYNNIGLILKNNFSGYFGNKIIYRPNYLYLADLSITYFLKYDNSISIGMKLSSFADYVINEKYIVNETNLLDAYLKLSITRRFSFCINAMNIEDKLFVGNVPLNGFHINSAIQWSFYN